MKGFILWQGSLERNPSVLIGSFLVRISPYGPFPCTKPYSFCFRKPANSKQAWAECHVINYLLTQLVRAVMGNIGPLSFFLYGNSVRTSTTSGQYSPVRPSRSVSKRLILFFVVVFFQMCFCSSCWN